MIRIDFGSLTLKLKSAEGVTKVFDPVRKSWMVLTPEEHVRQYFLVYLLAVKKYATAMLAVEKGIKVGTRLKRFDIVVYDRDHKPWMLVECKRPEVPIDEQALHQLLNYQQTMRCRYWVLTNGIDTYCADAADTDNIKWLTSMPDFPTSE
jgi:hypothetical protein